MLATTYAKKDEKMGDAVMRFLREYFTEEKMDDIIDAAMLRFPPLPKFIPKFFVRKVLDWMLPDKLIMLVEIGLRKAGALSSPDQPGFLDNVKV